MDPTGERPVFTPNEFLRAIEDYERLQAQSSELSSQLNRAAEAGDLRSLRELGRQNLNLSRQLNRARSRVEVLATATLDRLLHHCHVLQIDGRSFRLRQMDKKVS